MKISTEHRFSSASLTDHDLNVMMHEIANHILSNDGSWQKIGSDLGLTDHDLSRVYDYARVQLRKELTT